MMKKFLCGALAVALAAGTVVAPAADASAASVPKAKYTFNMNKKNKNVVAVARKNDTANYTTADTTNGTLPSASNAKKVKLKYTKGKHGKALYLDRTSSYGAQLKNVKLGSGSWTVSFWVKPSNSMSDYMSVFFTGSDIVNPKKCKWVSITSNSWLNGSSSPTIWSHNASLDKSDSNLHFPWYAYQNDEGTWLGSTDDAKAEALKKDTWTYVTLVVDTKDTCEYGVKGEDGYVKSYHAWTYVNGKLFGNGTIAKNSMSNKNLFFLGINAWDCPFKGYFDDVQFWNKALKAKQVKALYKKMK
jgi:hypothetical protein